MINTETCHSIGRIVKDTEIISTEQLLIVE